MCLPQASKRRHHGLQLPVVERGTTRQTSAPQQVDGLAKPKHTSRIRHAQALGQHTSSTSCAPEHAAQRAGVVCSPSPAQASPHSHLAAPPDDMAATSPSVQTVSGQVFETHAKYRIIKPVGSGAYGLVVCVQRRGTDAFVGAAFQDSVSPQAVSTYPARRLACPFAGARRILKLSRRWPSRKCPRPSKTA